MKKSFLILLIAACFAVQAQTIHVSGDQTGVWDADTVLVTGNVSVMDSLRILPGTVVLFDGFYKIDVRKGSTFVAQGTERDSIFFTVADTTGFHNYNSKKGGWNGLRLSKAGHFLMDYCVLEYGKAFLDSVWNGGALDVVNSDDVHVHHCTMHHHAAHKRGGAVSGIDSKLEMTDCSMHHNTVVDTIDYFIYGGAASFLKCDVELRGIEFRANDGSLCVGGALSLDSCSVVLDRSVFVDNLGVNGGGLYLMRSNDRDCKFSNLLFDDNYSVHFGGGFAVSDAAPEISNILVINNRSYGVSCCGIFFYGQCEPVLRNCIVYHNYPGYDDPMTDTTQMWVWTTDDFGPEFYHCLIEGGLRYIHSPENVKAFEDILDVDPMFVNEEMHDFHLVEGSPCINAGDPNTPQYVLDGMDLDGWYRVSNQRIDIGPYEYSGEAVSELSSVSFAKLIGNPLGAHSRIEFDRAMEGEVTLSVYAIIGRCMVEKTLNLKGSQSFAMDELAEKLVPGVYLIALRHGNEVCTLKAVK